MSLEVQEFEVVGALVPLVLLVVVARSRQAHHLLIELEALLHTEMKVVAEGTTLRRALRFLASVRAGAQVCRRPRLGVWETRRDLDGRASALIVLPREEDKVVGCTSLELLVLDGFVMLCFVLADSGVVSTNDELCVDAFVHP